MDARVCGWSLRWSRQKRYIKTWLQKPSFSHLRQLLHRLPRLCCEQACSGHGTCQGSGIGGYCICTVGFTGSACGDCRPGFQRIGDRCIFLPGALGSCSDGARNGDEAGVDCGGRCVACTTSLGGLHQVRLGPSSWCSSSWCHCATVQSATTQEAREVAIARRQPCDDVLAHSRHRGTQQLSD